MSYKYSQSQTRLFNSLQQIRICPQHMLASFVDQLDNLINRLRRHKSGKAL